MKPNHARQRTGGFTGWDLVIVMATLALACVFLLPALAKKRSKAARINCVSRLKQIGLAFRMWSNDNDGRFPWSVSTNELGTLELSQSGNPLPHFLAVSNELNSPRTLVCPSDPTITKVASFDQLMNRRQLSYFVGLDADETRPNSILSGDRTISTNAQYHSGLVLWATNAAVVWAPGVHSHGVGHLGFGDGSAQQVTNQGTWIFRAANTNPVFRLVIP